jgi:hypothetical protein
VETRLLSTHATVVGTSSSCESKIEQVHLVHGRLNLLDVDRLLDIGFVLRSAIQLEEAG